MTIMEPEAQFEKEALQAFRNQLPVRDLPGVVPALSKPGPMIPLICSSNSNPANATSLAAQA